MYFTRRDNQLFSARDGSLCLSSRVLCFGLVKFIIVPFPFYVAVYKSLALRKCAFSSNKNRDVSLPHLCMKWIQAQAGCALIARLRRLCAATSCRV